MSPISHRTFSREWTTSKRFKDAVLAGITKPVALTGAGKIGVQGMGGIGKTVLAAALAHDAEVRQAFSDGIYWLTAGQTSNLLDLQNQLLRQFTGSKETLISVQEAKDALREALEGKAVLLVVDDAWTIDHADAFSVTAPPARLIVTTRNAEVLVGLGAEEHRVEVLSPSDALKMLAEWVGEKSPDKLSVEAAEVAKKCGYLPLALAMIGAMIRLRPTAWKDVLIRLHRADLGAIKRAFPGYPYPDLLRAIEVSIDALEAVDQERYVDLAMFPEDQPIPEEPLAALWKLEEMDTPDCMTRFVARSLATWTTGENALILHDLQRDLIRKRRENNLPDLHLRLVEAWDALPKLPDTYAWRWVAYHLVQSGRKDNVRRLLLDFDYLQGKLEATDPNALLADYDYLAGEGELKLIQSTIQLSAHVLFRDSRQLAGQLLGRLLGHETINIQALLEQVAEGKPWPWFRPLNRNLTAPEGFLTRAPECHNTDWVRAVAVTVDGQRAVSASYDRTLRLWDLESGRTLRLLEGHQGWVRAVAVTADGRRAVSGSDDRTLRLWDLSTGQTIRTFEGHKDWVRTVAVTADGQRAVSGSDDRTLRLWDLERGQTIRLLEGHTDWVRAVAVAADGRQAVSGSDDRTLRLWDLGTGQSIGTLKGHAHFVNAVAVTPDGRRAVSGSWDRTLWLWDLKSGETIHLLQGHTEGVRAVAVTADGRRAVSGSWDETLRLWDLDSGSEITIFTAERPMYSCVFAGDGRTIVAGDESGQVQSPGAHGSEPNKASNRRDKDSAPTPQTAWN
jgi:WD40 repeat protein